LRALHVTLVFVSALPRTTVAATSAVEVELGFVTTTSNCAEPPPGTAVTGPDIAMDTRSGIAAGSLFPPVLDPPVFDPPAFDPLLPESLPPPPPQAHSESANTMASMRIGIEISTEPVLIILPLG